MTKANYGVLNIPDFLGAELDRDYFLNTVNVHPNTIIKALKAAGFSVNEIDDKLIAQVMDALRDLLAKRHSGAKVRYSKLLDEILSFYNDSQMSYDEIVKLARSVRELCLAM